jgi:MFS family permease
VALAKLASQMKKILPIIVIAQFFCTSLWFAGNAIIGDIAAQFKLDVSYLAYLTSTVQFGFISGTLVFALLSVADRFSPSKVFFICATLAAVVNLAIGFDGINVFILILCRFLTGFFLAGIYPVGMKIAADHYEQKLGKSLGWLVGALVIGTAFPFLLKSIGFLPWRDVIFTISALSFCGGTAILLGVPDGPYRKPGQKLKLGAFLTCFKHKRFNAVAFGYFGHNWELYAFWVFLPLMLAHYSHQHHVDLNIPLLIFLIIGSGGVACVISGIIAQRFGAKKIATIALSISFTCCLLSPILLKSSPIIFIIFLFIWGMTVVADSPLFSTLVAQNAVGELKGTALTIVTCIGFTITIISIQLVSALRTTENTNFIFLLLGLGPIAGLTALIKNK